MRIFKFIFTVLFSLTVIVGWVDAAIYYSLVCESGISGSYWTGLTAGQKVRYTNGTDSCVYSTPQAWSTARDRNLGSDTEHCEIAGTWENGMSTALDIDYSPWVTTNPGQLVIVGVGSSRAGSQWSTSKFRFATSGASIIFNNNCNIDLTIKNLQFDCSASGSAVANMASWSSGYRRVVLDGNHIIGNNGEYVSGIFIRNNHGGGGAPYADSVHAYIVNNIISGFTGATVGIAVYPYTSSDGGNIKVFAYNNTIRNCRVGISLYGTSCRAINNVIQDCSGARYYSDGGTWLTGSTTNVSDNNDAPGTGAINGEVAFEDEAASPPDLRLDATDEVATGAGTDLTSDTYYPFEISIDSTARTGWDAGAFENSTACTPATTESDTLTDTIGDTMRRLLRVTGENDSTRLVETWPDSSALVGYTTNDSIAFHWKAKQSIANFDWRTYSCGASKDSSTSHLRITIVGGTPAYSGSPFTCTTGVAIPTLSPDNTTLIDSFTCSPPTGISINLTSGAFTGTPTVEAGATNYYVYAWRRGIKEDSVQVSFTVIDTSYQPPIVTGFDTVWTTSREIKVQWDSVGCTFFALFLDGMFFDSVVHNGTSAVYDDTLRLLDAGRQYTISIAAIDTTVTGNDTFNIDYDFYFANVDSTAKSDSVVVTTDVLALGDTLLNPDDFLTHYSGAFNPFANGDAGEYTYRNDPAVYRRNDSATIFIAGNATTGHQLTEVTIPTPVDGAIGAIPHSTVIQGPVNCMPPSRKTGEGFCDEGLGLHVVGNRLYTSFGCNWQLSAHDRLNSWGQPLFILAIRYGVGGT